MTLLGRLPAASLPPELFRPGRFGVLVRRSGGTDRYGDPRPPVYFAVADCVAWPRTSREDDDYAQSTSTGVMLSIPAGVRIHATDQIQFPNSTPWWSVVGDPAVWGPSPFSDWDAGSLVALELRTG